MSKKQLITAYLTPEQMSGLREVAAITRVPLSQYVREGIDMVLAKKGVQDAKDDHGAGKIGGDMAGGEPRADDGERVLLPPADDDFF